MRKPKLDDIPCITEGQRQRLSMAICIATRLHCGSIACIADEQLMRHPDMPKTTATASLAIAGLPRAGHTSWLAAEDVRNSRTCPAVMTPLSDISSVAGKLPPECSNEINETRPRGD